MLTVSTTSSLASPQLGVASLVTVSCSVTVRIPVTSTSVAALFGVSMEELAEPVVPTSLHIGVPPDTVPLRLNVVVPSSS
jgi:hypothetical protein